MKDRNILEEYRRSPVTFTFMVIILAYYLIISLNGGSQNPLVLVKFGALFPPFVKEFNQFYRFITSIFIHIGITHLLFNGYALYVFGTQIERLMGSVKYLFFFLLTGIGGNIATYIFNFESISAGASGSLFGVLGVFLYLIRHHRHMITNQGRKSILQLLGINILITILVPSISVTAHFGGLISGYLLSFIFIK